MGKSCTKVEEKANEEVENEMDVKEAMEEKMEMQEVYKWVAKKLGGELDRNQEDRVDGVMEKLVDEEIGSLEVHWCTRATGALCTS